jgi:hypothetical protein
MITIKVKKDYIISELEKEIKGIKRDMKQCHDKTVKDIMSIDVDDLTANEAFDRGLIRGYEGAISFINYNM